MNKIEFFKNEKKDWGGGGGGVLSQEDILGLAISLIFYQFSIL